MKNEQILPVAVAAQIAGIDRRRMYEAIKDKRIKSTEQFGRTGILPSELKRYQKILNGNKKKNGK